MDSGYVEEREGGYYVTGTRVPLDGLVFGFRRGESAETLRQSYPVLSLADVYGSIAFYLENQARIDELLGVENLEAAPAGTPLSEINPNLWARIQAARAKTGRQPS